MTAMITPSQIYALRETNLLDVPPQVLEIISMMQLSPVAQVYTKKPTYRKPTFNVPSAERVGSWRTDTIIMAKKMNFKHDDEDFATVLAKSNKVSTSTVGKVASEIVETIRKRDQVFRLKTVAMLFDRGVSMPFYSKLVANLFELLHKDIPEIKDDLQFSCSIDIFNKMFDQTETIAYPSSVDADYEDKLCEWTRKKEIRRGFGMFVTELHIRGLVDESVIVNAMKVATEELIEMVQKPTDKCIGETVDQLVTLMFETGKIVVTRYGKDHPLMTLLTETTTKVLEIPKDRAPCLGMRSKFKLEDIKKL